MRIVYDAHGYRQEYDLPLAEVERILRNQEWLLREAARYGRLLTRAWVLL